MMMALNLKSTIHFNQFRYFKRFILFYSAHPAPLKRAGKLFLESENEFSHNILYRLPQYKNSIIPPYLKHVPNVISIGPLQEKTDTKWEALTLNELCTIFEKCSVEAKLNSVPLDQTHSDMCSVIAKRCPEISDELLISLLCHLAFWPFSSSPNDPNFSTLWKAFDKTCLERWKLWDTDKILLFIDLWYNLQLTRLSDFVYRSITKTAKKPSRLSSHQIVQLLFYLSVIRTINKKISMYDIEHRLQSVVHQLSIEEIGVAALGFFKTQSPILSEKLISYLMDRVIEECSTVPEITLASILKAFRLSLTIPLWERVPELLDVLEPQIERLSLQCIIHINLLAAKSFTRHEGILTKTTTKLSEYIKNARLKDMERILWPLSVLNFTPSSTPCIFESVVNEINNPSRSDEIELYPKSMASLVYYLTLKNYFVENAVAKALDMNFIRRTYGRTNFMIGREILGIDTYVELMCPSYTGPRLPVDVRNYLSKRYSKFVPDPQRRLSKHEQFTLDVFKTSRKLFGNDSVLFKYIVPHHSRADIVFNLNKDKKSLSIPQEYRNIEDFTGPIRAPDHGTWYAIVIASRNMFLHNAPIVTGETSSKMEMLKRLNYVPVMISFLDWPKEEEEKLKFLQKLIVRMK